MNLFHSIPGPLPEADLHLGQALADIATIGILQERAIRHGEVLAEQLQTALEQPRHRGTGQGCPCAVRQHRHGRPRSTACDDHARSRNLRLVDVARRVVGERNYGPPGARLTTVNGGFPVR